MRGDRGVVAAVVAAALAHAAPAAAEPASPIAVEVAPCVDADRAELDRLLALELGAARPGAVIVADAGGAAATLTIDCDGDAVRIGWADRDGARARVLNPGAAPGRERTLALAAAELAAAPWDAPVAAAPPPAPPIAIVAPPPPAAAAPPRWRTTVTLGPTVVVAEALAAPGGSLRIARERPAWGWAAEAGVARARDGVALGAIELDAATAAAGAHVALDGLARVRIGAGARVTAARFRGDAMAGVTAGEVTGVAGGPLADAGATACAGAVCVDAGVEAGWHVLAVRAQVDGATATALDGPWWAARAAVGWRW